MTDRQRILGIDPGSRLTGFGVLDCVEDCATYVASGAVNTIEGEFKDRIKLIFDSINAIVSEYRPNVVAIESIFIARNAFASYLPWTVAKFSGVKPIGPK